MIPATAEFFRFAHTLLPHAFGLIGDLYRLHRGDTQSALQDIQDRRHEVRAMWERREAELKAKRYPGEAP